MKDPRKRKAPKKYFGRWAWGRDTVSRLQSFRATHRLIVGLRWLQANSTPWSEFENNVGEDSTNKAT